MGLNKEKRVWVIGHKNPDTDSICSAIAYANLKNKTEGDHFAPKRAGDLNGETRYVLEKFQIPEPELETDAGAQVKDIEIRRTPGVSSSISLKKAWEMMKERNIVTLPITNDRNRLIGIISTTDITTSYMDIYDNRILSRAQTSYRNILDTLEGTMLCGDETASFTEGKVVVGSANPEIMEEYLDEGDLVILGSRYEAQVCAIENNVGCLVVAGNPKVSKTIIRQANEHGVTLITTPYDTYTTARLMNQSMPLQHFMITENLVTFHSEDYVDDVRETLSHDRRRDFPILDENGYYVGTISRRNLLNMQKKRLILVDHNEKTQAIDSIDEADILEVIDHHRIGSLETLSPVYFRNQPVGCTATIIYQMYQEQNVEVDPAIAGILCSAILSDTLMYRSPTCTPMDIRTAEELAKIAGIDVETHAKAMFRAGSDFSSKTPEEILNQDYKIFTQGKVTFGVDQVTAMTREDLGEAMEKLTPYLETALEEQKIDMIFVMLTNIVTETTYLLGVGEMAAELIEAAYHAPMEDNCYVLKDVVSRKKQLIPALITALHQIS